VVVHDHRRPAALDQLDQKLAALDVQLSTDQTASLDRLSETDAQLPRPVHESGDDVSQVRDHGQRPGGCAVAARAEVRRGTLLTNAMLATAGRARVPFDAIVQALTVAVLVFRHHKLGLRQRRRRCICATRLRAK